VEEIVSEPVAHTQRARDVTEADLVEFATERRVMRIEIGAANFTAREYRRTARVVALLLHEKRYSSTTSKLSSAEQYSFVTVQAVVGVGASTLTPPSQHPARACV
jgi:hypothetical protein